MVALTLDVPPRSGTLGREVLRSLVLVIVGVTFAGCVSIGVSDVAAMYYARGPEAALNLVRFIEVSPAERSMVERDRSVAFIELGYYEDAIESLLSVTEIEEAAVNPWPLSIHTESGVFLGENHERIMVPTLAVVSALAVQDFHEAAAWADRSLAMARGLGSGPGSAPSTWVLSALAYEAVGRIGAAQNAYYEASFGSGVEDGSAAAVQHLTAVDPVERSLVVVMLLGSGPRKSEGWVTLPSGEAVAWPAYEHDAGSASMAASASTGGGEEMWSVEIEDLWATARDGLGRRYDEILSSPGAVDADERDTQVVGEALSVDESTASTILSAFNGTPDLESWWSLPATVHLIRLPVPDTARKATLKVEDERGKRHWDEVFRIPSEWEAGPLFVVRRVP